MIVKIKKLIFLLETLKHKNKSRLELELRKMIKKFQICSKKKYFGNKFIDFRGKKMKIKYDQT